MYISEYFSKYKLNDLPASQHCMQSSKINVILYPHPSAINLPVISFEFQYNENLKEKQKSLTPSDASIKIITPSHSLNAAVTSSEKLTCPAEMQISKKQREEK